MTEHNNTKLRAVFLAALMVLWVFAGAVAFTGSAAAQQDTSPANTADATVADLTVSDSDQQQRVNYLNVTNSSSFGQNEVNFYVNVTSLSANASVGTDSLGTSNYQVNNSTHGDITDNVTISQESFNQNSGNEVLTIDISGDAVATSTALNLSFTITGLDTSGAEVSSGHQFWYNATGGSTADSSLDGSNSAVDATSGEATSSYAITGAGSYENAPETDEPWESGDVGYQGQVLRFVAVDNPNQHNYRLRHYDSTATQPVGGIAQEPTFTRTADSRWVWAMQTENLEGQYVITKNGSTLANTVSTNSNGVEQSTGGDSNAVSILVQNLNAEFTEDEVALNQDAYLEVSSVRSGFDVEVTSPQLDPGELSAIFNVNANQETDDGVQLQNIQGNDNLTVDFGADDADLDPGEYTLDLAVNDTTAEASASINVTEEVEGDASFDQSQFIVPRGDIANITLTTEENVDTVNITVGNEDQGYKASFHASPNDDDKIVIHMNTYLAGRPGVNPDDVFDAEEGSIETGVTRHTNDVPEVLDVESYDVSVSSVPTGNQESEEFDLSTLVLVERETGDVTVHTAPHDRFSDLDDLEGVLEEMEEGRVTESGEIAVNTERDDQDARGDVVVAEVSVSGVFGALQAGQANGINFEIEQTNPDPNTVAKRLNFTNSNIRTVTDAENQTIYYIAPVDELSFNRSDTNPQAYQVANGDEFNVTLNVTTDYLANFTSENLESPEDDETTTDTFEVVDREATFDTTDDLVQVASASNQTITGTTTIAPGTEIRVRARATGDGAFLKSVETTVDDDGTFTGTFTGEESFGDIPAGTNFTATIPQQSYDENAETDGRVVEQVVTPTATPTTPTPTPTTPTPTATPEPPTPTPTPTDSGQPGFGAVVALIALLGAALLAARRNAF